MEEKRNFDLRSALPIFARQAQKFNDAFLILIISTVLLVSFLRQISPSAIVCYRLQ